ncbi:MAG: PrsW family intramembrane metalloprotease [Chitinophagales bacterium]|nr:PrsW family intramembrane metalloprotease [Chitinophagales bacterium]MBP9550091.1 PrsW family intramembrane metalloprotease [Chitinophagales bacterium]MBP9704915.1 PrsW family intramembrane metalloprotease [Chitinophagales bacterium]
MDTQTLALIAMAIGPAIAIMIYFYAKDKHEREPFGILLVSFLWGCFSVVPAIILESILPGIIPGSGGSSVISVAIYTFVVIAFSEELSKFIFLRYYSYKKRSFNEPFDGIIYAVMVGMGFATVENLLYVFDSDTLGSAWSTAGLRALTAIPAHATFAAIMGYYVGLAKFSKTNEKGYLLQGLLLATVLHGFYDFFLFQNLHVGLYIGAAISLILGIRYSMRAIKMHNAISPFNEENKVVEPEEIIVTSYESPFKPTSDK